MPSVSSRSVLARRARRLTRMLVGSRTWQTTPCAVSKRCSQKPSRPASKQQTTSASSPRAARACRDEIRANKAAVSPPSIRCRCGFSTPGTRAARSHVDALSSIARRIVGLMVSIVCIVAAPSLRFGAAKVSAQPVLIASGTRPQSAFPGRVWSRSPRPAWESFFKCRDRLRILHGMARPGAEVREAELLERAPQAHLRQIDTEALSENTLQVDAAPAYDPILLRVGAGLDKLLQCLFLLVGELRRPPGRLDVDQTIRTVLVEAVRPVPQRLPVHAADPRRLGAVHPV